MKNKVLSWLSVMNGWQRLWFLSNGLFFVAYLTLFLIVPSGFNKTLAYDLPLHEFIKYREFDFPSYEERRSSFVSNAQFDEVYLDARKLTKNWLREKFPDLMGSVLISEDEETRVPHCYAFDVKKLFNQQPLIRFDYRTKGVYQAQEFKSFSFGRQWVDIDNTPYAKNADCFISIEIQKPFLVFYRKFFEATSDETTQIAEFLLGKAESLLWRERLFWVLKSLLVVVGFAALLYGTGLAVNWIRLGFHIK